MEWMRSGSRPRRDWEPATTPSGNATELQRSVAAAPVVVRPQLLLRFALGFSNPLPAGGTQARAAAAPPPMRSGSGLVLPAGGEGNEIFQREVAETIEATVVAPPVRSAMAEAGLGLVMSTATAGTWGTLGLAAGCCGGSAASASAVRSGASSGGAFLLPVASV